MFISVSWSKQRIFSLSSVSISEYGVYIYIYIYIYISTLRWHHWRFAWVIKVWNRVAKHTHLMSTGASARPQPHRLMMFVGSLRTRNSGSLLSSARRSRQGRRARGHGAAGARRVRPFGQKRVVRQTPAPKFPPRTFNGPRRFFFLRVGYRLAPWTIYLGLV